MGHFSLVSVVAAAAKSLGCGDLQPWSLRASRDFGGDPHNRQRLRCFAAGEAKLIECFRGQYRGGGGNFTQFLAVPWTLFSCSKMRFFYLRTCTPVNGHCGHCDFAMRALGRYLLSGTKNQPKEEGLAYGHPAENFSQALQVLEKEALRPGHPARTSLMTNFV